MSAFLLANACSPWTDVESVRGCCGGVATTNDDVVEDSINLATDLLFTLSGKQFPGTCTETIRPCTTGQTCFYAWWLRDPDSFPLRVCGCAWTPQRDLGKWPVTDVTEVLIDGVVLAPSKYRIDEYRYLVRMAGPAPDYVNDGWPRCQHLDRPTTEEGTWSVTFEYGLAVSAGAESAVRTLACELVKACTPGTNCELPGRATRVDRQGVSVTLMDPNLLAQGLTGLYLVDLWLKAVNPDGHRGSARIWSPDLSVGGRRAGT